MNSIDNIKTIIERTPKPRKIKLSLSEVISIFENKKEISCGEYNDFREISQKLLRKKDREEILKYFKLKPDSSGYEFIKF